MLPNQKKYKLIYAAVESCKSSSSDKEKFDTLLRQLNRVDEVGVCLITIANELVREIELTTVSDLKRDIDSIIRLQKKNNRKPLNTEAAQ